MPPWSWKRNTDLPILSLICCDVEYDTTRGLGARELADGSGVVLSCPRCDRDLAVAAPRQTRTVFGTDSPSVISLLVAAEKTGHWNWPVLALELLEEYGWLLIRRGNSEPPTWGQSET